TCWVVGMPVTAPVVALRLRSAGSAPALMAHVYGAVPPAAEQDPEYAAPTVPSGSVQVTVMPVPAVVVKVKQHAPRQMLKSEKPGFPCASMPPMPQLPVVEGGRPVTVMVSV